MRPRVDLNQLRAAVAVAETGSFTRAAKRLFLSQPTLSGTVRQLESTLQVQLFRRTTRRVTLTAPGAEFVAQAKSLLDALETAIDRVQAHTRREGRRVSLAALPAVASKLVPDVFRAFIQQNPDVAISLCDAAPKEIVSQLKSGEVDLGVTCRIDDSEIEQQPVLRDRYCVICHEEHWLAGDTDNAGHKTAVPWRTLKHCTVLSVDAGNDAPVDAWLDAITSSVAAVGSEDGASGTSFPVPQRVASMTTLAAMVQAGLGVGVFPMLDAPSTTDRPLRVRPLRDPVVKREICLVKVKGRVLSPIAERLWSMLASGIEANSPRRMEQPRAGLSAIPWKICGAS